MSRQIQDTDEEIIGLSTEDKVRLCYMIPKYFCRDCAICSYSIGHFTTALEFYQKQTQGKFFCRSWCEIDWSLAMEKVVTEKLLGVDALISKISGQYLEEKCQ
jgi:hypothetical protein